MPATDIERKTIQLQVIDAVLDLFQNPSADFPDEDKHLLHWHYDDLIKLLSDVRGSIDEGKLL